MNRWHKAALILACWAEFIIIMGLIDMPLWVEQVCIIPVSLVAGVGFASATRGRI